VKQKRILDAAQMEAALDRMAEALLAQCEAPEALCLVGIRRGGVPLADRLADRIEPKLGRAVEKGTLDITLYRDDLLGGLDQPQVGPTRLRFGLKDRWVVLVDDVVFTGRTVRAAIDALMDFGRPRRIVLAALVDRGGRELPIQPDVVGEVLEVAPGASVEVRLAETHGRDEVLLISAPKGTRGAR